MVYAFSRDGAVPFSSFWHHVSRGAHVPVRTAWFGAIGAFILALPYWYNIAAYAAVTSIAVIGLYISYLTPVFLRRINPGAFKPGPWVLSKTWGPIINWIAIVWVVFIVILLMLPQYNTAVPWAADFTFTAFNYAPIAVLVVVGGAGLGTPPRPASGSRARRCRVPPKSSPRSSATSASESRRISSAPERGGPHGPPLSSCETLRRRFLVAPARGAARLPSRRLAADSPVTPSAAC